MIRRAFLMRGDGHVLFVRHYVDEVALSTSAPAHVCACVTLFHSHESTSLGSPYVLQQDDVIWMYCFFSTFVLVIEATKDEPIEWLRRRILSLGKTIARDYSHILSTWSGNLLDVEGLLETFDNFLSLPVKLLTGSQLSRIEVAVNQVLAKYPIAYAGVLDESGEMISGNVPDDHLSAIQTRVLNGSVNPTVDIVPTVLEIDEYKIHLLRIHSLTAVATPYPDESPLKAVQAINDIVQSLIGIID